jgi:hypothetical protein
MSDIFNESDGQFDIDAIGKLEEEYYSQNSLKNPSQNKKMKVEFNSQSDLGVNRGKTEVDISRNQSAHYEMSGFRKSSQIFSDRQHERGTPALARGYEKDIPCKGFASEIYAECEKRSDHNVQVCSTSIKFPLRKGVFNGPSDISCGNPRRLLISETVADHANNRTEIISDQQNLNLDLAVNFSDEIITGAPNLTIGHDSKLKTDFSCSDKDSNEFRTAQKSLSVGLTCLPSELQSVNPRLRSELEDALKSHNVKDSCALTPRISDRDTCQVTPMRATSLKDKLKQRLQENAQKSMPQNLRLQNLRRESLEIAKREAEKIQSEGTEYDIGPFYGLPSKVKGLFEKLRGISKFYGKSKVLQLHQS